MRSYDNLKDYLRAQMANAMDRENPGAAREYSKALMGVYQAEALTTIADVMASKWERENAL